MTARCLTLFNREPDPPVRVRVERAVQGQFMNSFSKRFSCLGKRRAIATVFFALQPFSVHAGGAALHGTMVPCRTTPGAWLGKRRAIATPRVAAPSARGRVWEGGRVGLIHSAKRGRVPRAPHRRSLVIERLRITPHPPTCHLLNLLVHRAAVQVGQEDDPRVDVLPA